MPQVKEEGWWLVLGDAATQDLHAVKRTSFAERASARLAFETPASGAGAPPSLTLFLVRHACCELGPACMGSSHRRQWFVCLPPRP